MVQEATMICIDNSEWMRNGDFSPNRFESQKDAVNLVTGSKINHNPQSSVGVIAMSGPSSNPLCALTSDPGKILAEIHKVHIEGQSNFIRAIGVAQLALKHRSNKRQEQRIIAFVGSPISATAKELELLGKKLKKNKVAVDLILFGEENQQKLEALRNAVNNDDNSHLLVLPPSGLSAVSELLLSSPIIARDGGGGTVGSNAFEFGVDPNVDPELVMVLRMSMEEDARRRAAEAEKQKQVSQTEAPSENPQPVAHPSVEPTAPDQVMSDADETDEQLLREALALSVEAGGSGSADQSVPLPKDQTATVEMDEDLKMALMMSNEGGDQTKEKEDLDLSQVSQDPQFMKSMLEQLDGVDPNDPSIKSLLDSLNQEKKDDEKDKESK